MDNNTVKIEIEVYSQDQWYSIIQELNRLYGPGSWRGQKHVKRKFLRQTANAPLKVWFEIPNTSSASYLQIKYSNTNG